MNESIDSTIAVSGAGSEKPNDRDVHVLVKVSGADEEYRCHFPEGDLKYAKFGGTFKDYTTIKIDIVDTADGSVKKTITYTDTTCDESETTRQLEDNAVGGVQEPTDGELNFDVINSTLRTTSDSFPSQYNWMVKIGVQQYYVHVDVSGQLVLGDRVPICGAASATFSLSGGLGPGYFVIRAAGLLPEYSYCLTLPSSGTGGIQLDNPKDGISEWFIKDFAHYGPVTWHNFSKKTNHPPIMAVEMKEGIYPYQLTTNPSATGIPCESRFLSL